VQYVALRPADGTAPKAAVFLIGGGNFDLLFNGNAATGAATLIGGNFLVRSAQLFANAGHLAIAMNRPSDQPPAGSVDVVGDVDLYRISVDHAAKLPDDTLEDLRRRSAPSQPGAWLRAAPRARAAQPAGRLHL